MFLRALVTLQNAVYIQYVFLVCMTFRITGPISLFYLRGINSKGPNYLEQGSAECNANGLASI